MASMRGGSWVTLGRRPVPIDPDEFEFTPEELDELLATTDERSPEEMVQVEARLRIFAKQLRDAGFGGTELPDDLVELKDAVSNAWIMRELANVPMTHPFESYQLLDTKLGGMGMVLEGLDPRLDRKVAIKMWISDDEKAKAGALEEAKTLAKLDHVNIVKVYDTGVWNGRVYFVMEWVEGANGAEWIDDEDETHDWRTVRDVYVAAGRGLAHAHRKGIAHRDFKPSNILVGAESGVVKVADFGIADRLRSSTPEVRSPKVGGSRSYMAPERPGRGSAGGSVLVLRRAVGGAV